MVCHSSQDVRAKYVLNQPHYWGVLDRCSHYPELFRKKLGIGEELWWEFPSGNPSHNGELVLAISNKKLWYLIDDDDRDHWMNDNYLTTYSLFDRGTTYIKRVKTCIGIKYCVTNYMDHFLTTCTSTDMDNKFINSARFFDSIEDVFAFVHEKHVKKVHFSAKICDCRKISRFSHKCKRRRKRIGNEVWSLQELSAFFIKQYSFYNRKALFNMQHHVCRNIIMSSDAVAKQFIKSDTCTCYFDCKYHEKKM